MMQIYIFDEHDSSKQNGIGTFMRCLTMAMKDVADVSILSFNDDMHIFHKENLEDVHFYHFPKYSNGSFLNNSEAALTILSTEIEDRAENIFIVNHFPCTRLLDNLRRSFPMSKLVFIIHDQLWTELLNGDHAKLKIPNNCAVTQAIKTERDMYNMADAVICLNLDTQKQLQDIYKISQNKITLIPSGINIGNKGITQKDIIRKKLLIKYSEIVFLFVGRPTKFKGINDTLIAFDHIAPLHPEAKLVILGQIIDQQELSALCPNSISNVVFAGLVNADKLHEWYIAADYGIMSSYYEQFGYAGVEMMAHGLPVVASDAYGTRTMFRDGYNAIVAHIGNRDNPEEYQNNLADAMTKAIEMNETQYATMSANARECYKQHYTLANMREGYLRMFEKLIDGQEEHQAHSAVNSELPMKERLYHLILHSCDVQDCGLLHGKMGIALALTTYARQHKQKAIEDYAGYLLKRTLRSLHKNMAWSFGHGLCGIVWGIEYLVQNGYMDIDTAEVCEELDSKIMQVSPLRIEEESIENGLEGLFVYANAHLKRNRNNIKHAKAFISELETIAGKKYATMSPSFQKEARLLTTSEGNLDYTYNLSLKRFISVKEESFISWRDLSLSTGLAGLIL